MAQSPKSRTPKNSSKEVEFTTLISHFMKSPMGVILIDPETMQPVDFNLAAFSLLGLSKEELLEINIQDYEPRLGLNGFSQYISRAVGNEFVSFRTWLTTQDGKTKFFHFDLQPVEGDNRKYIYAIFNDISEELLIDEVSSVERELLQICNSANSKRDLIHRVLSFFKSYTGCDAAGIRLHEGDDFPYFETKGFPEKFVEAESKLCVYDDQGIVLKTATGNPVLECMCGNILCGRFDPGKEFFTGNGSFWTGSTTQLLAITSEEDRQSRTRNRCNGEGYESVALIPIRLNNKTFGLFQFNDKRVGLYSAKKITILEHLIDSVAFSLARFETEEALETSEMNFREILNSTTEPVLIHDAETGRILDVNDTTLKTFGFTSKSEALSKTIADLSHGDRTAALTRGMELIKKANLEGPQVFEWLAKKTNGATFWTEIVLNRVIIAGKNRVLAVIRDISERKRMEEALNYSTERYRLLFEEMTEGFALHEIILNEKGTPIDYRFLDVNPAFELLTGLSKEKLIGNTAKEVLPGLEDFWIENYGQVALRGEELRFENFTVEVGKWFKVTAYCPKFGQFATIFEDITSRKKSDLALKESEELFRSTFEQTSIGMCLVSPDGDFRRVNSAFCKMIGYSSEELVGRPVHLITHPEDISVTSEKLQQPKNSPENYVQFEKRYIHKSGKIVWVSLSSTLLRGDNEAPRYFITQIQDITNRKQAEEALLLRDKIFTRSLDMLCIAGSDGYFKILNPAWEATLGWSVEELRSKPWIDFVMPADQERTYTVKTKFLDTGQEILQFENRYICKDGSIKWLSWNSYPYPDEKIMIGVARDITENKKLDETVRQINEKYQLIDQSSSDYIYSYDTEGRFTHANSSLLKALGLDLDKIIGKTHSELGFPPDQCEEWNILHNRVYETNVTVISETTATIQGNLKYFEVVLNPMHDADGKIIGISGTTRDIHDRKMAEKKVQEQMEELQRWNSVTVGRENRVIELKEEVNQLLQQMNLPPRYMIGSNSEQANGN